MQLPRLLSLLFALLSLSPGLSTATDADVVSIPAVLRPFLDELERPSRLLGLPPVGSRGLQDRISKAEAEKDLDLFLGLLSEAYSGYPVMKSLGFQASTLRQDLRAWIEAETEPLSVETFQAQLAAELSDFVRDGHFSLQGRERSGFYHHHTIHYASVLLREDQGEILVHQSHEPRLSPGARYTGSRDLLRPTLSPRGTRFYLLGPLSPSPLSGFRFEFDSEVVDLPVHPSRSTRTERVPEGLRRRQERGSEVLTLASFSVRYHDAMQALPQVGAELREAPRVLVDVRGNGGGSGRYPRAFVEALNGGVAQWRSAFAELLSPPVLRQLTDLSAYSNPPPFLIRRAKRAQGALEKFRANPLRIWNRLRPLEEPLLGDYPGRAVLLMDRGVASSGEGLVAMFSSIPNAIRVGENTAGAGTFGEVGTYRLPGSGLRVHLPYKLILQPDSPEERGFLPDFWLDHPNPEAYVLEWMEAPETFSPRLGV